MSQGFTPEFLEELKYKCDIVEIISQYVPLQKKGGRYFGCCPFHNEKTGSFCVNQAEGFYHCFGCGASGDVIKFIQEIESVSFFDAVKYLADKVGMPLPEFKIDPEYGKKKERRDTLKSVMRDAALYYRNNLLDPEKGKAAREYLSARGLGDDASKRYGLGLSLDYDGMVKYLRYKNYTLADLFDCGLIASKENPFDAFANRIIVPIINSMDEVVAFGGRIYHGETDVAKYKNSTNTPLFDKGHIIFGLNYVKRDRKQGEVLERLILVEGYMDVIALGAAGIYGAVAGMGTALTEGQARDLRRLSERIYVCYDGDGAGQKATGKNLDTLTAAGLDVRVVTLPDGKDPDETVRSEGKEGFLKYLDAALPVIEYKLKLIESASELSSLDGRAKYAREAAKLLKTIDDRTQRAVYVSIVSKKSGLSEEQLETSITGVKSGVQNLDPPSRRPMTSGGAVEVRQADARELRAARVVLASLVRKREYADISLVKKAWLPMAVHVMIFEALCENKDFSVGSIYSYVEPDAEVDKIVGQQLPEDGATAKKLYDDCLICIADGYISARLKALNAKYGSLTDPEEKKATVLEIAKLQKQLGSRSITDKQ